MTDTTWTGGIARAKAETATRPEPPRKTGWPLITDAVTPAGGETLLSLLWKRDLERLASDRVED